MCMKVYLVSRKTEGVKQSTLGQYKLGLTHFFETVRMPIEQIDANRIRLYLYEYQQQHGVSDRTLDGVRTIICTFFKWAYAEGYIQTNPTLNIKSIKYVPKERGSLSEDEMELLRSSCVTKRDKAMIEFFYSTGCRVSELCEVRKEDIDLTKGTVRLFGKGEKWRTSYLNPKCKMAVKQYLTSRTDSDPWLFVSVRGHKKMTKSGVEKCIRALGKSVGLRVYPHLIRHTTATIALKRGADVTEIQQLLGHTNINTTMIYADVCQENVVDMHRKCVV